MVDEPIGEFEKLTAGRYPIVRELGRGGMATVYLARDLRHDRFVALKTLHPEFAASVGADRFLREIRVAARIQHPNVVPVFDSGGEGAALWYTMPYVEGESLRECLNREGMLPTAKAVAIARQVASALASAHADGVVHRDIKPENILLRAEHAMVADFGIARPAAAPEGLTAVGMSVGTPAYMSPEQVSGDLVDGRSDVFSLGCVLYEMLAGQLPFAGPTQQAMMAKRLVEPAPPLRVFRPDVPRWLEAALARALAREPMDRFGTAEEFATSLANDAAQQVTQPEDAVIRSPSSRRTQALIVIALAVFLGSALVVRSLFQRAPLEGSSRSLAVLDFENRSSDSTDGFLASGLTDEVTSRLSDLSRLRVKGRRAVSSLPEGDYRSIGRRLGVGYLVEGSVRRAAERVKVSILLVTTADGFTVWSKDYDGASRDLMGLQEEIARDVAQQIAGELLPAEEATLSARMTNDPDAHEHFLRGNFLLAQRNGPSTVRAISQFDLALTRDAGFTEARARSAYAHAQLLDWGWPFPGVATGTILARGLASSARALEEDSTIADAWLARGYLLTFADPHQFAGAEDALARAIAADPTSAEAHHQRGWVLHQLGRDSVALAAYHHALALEPERASTLRLIALVHMFAGRYAEAERWLDSTLNVDPAFYSAYGLRGLMRVKRGDVAGARADGETSLRLRSSDPIRGEFVLALAEAASGERATARQRVNRMLARVGNGPVQVWDAWYMAIAMLAIDDRARAVALLDRVRERGAVVRFAFSAAVVEPLRTAQRLRNP